MQTVLVSFLRANRITPSFKSTDITYATFIRPPFGILSCSIPHSALGIDATELALEEYRVTTEIFHIWPRRWPQAL